MNKLLSLVLIVCAATTAFAGSVVFDNGAPDQQNGNEMTAWIQSEDFSFAGNTTITGVNFWTIESGSGYAGSIWYGIYADGGGQPGSLLAQGLISSTGRTSTGVVALGQYDEYSFSFGITPFDALAGQTYWLGLHNGSLDTTSRNEVYWETTGSNGTMGGNEISLPEGAWSSNGNQHAFQLTAGTSPIPEPSTLVLLGAGLTVVGLWRRRRS